MDLDCLQFLEIEFGEIRLAPEDALDALVFVGSDAVFIEDFGSDGHREKTTKGTKGAKRRYLTTEGTEVHRGTRIL